MEKIFYISLLLFIIQINVSPVITTKIEGEYPIVHTKVGPIQGLTSKNGQYWEFMGIPYAQVNYENPFGAHLPQLPFNETFQAFNDLNVCVHKSWVNSTIMGTLDCLNLNIYVPKSVNTNKPLAVMVYIFGGKFVFGDASRHYYGPSYLVRHDVIYVIMNSRLNVYGYMCLDIPEVPGNQGVKDQVTALKWIKSNIGSFGGNSEKITLFGLSSGAFSVEYHMRYGNGDLFNRIILQDGTATSSVAIQLPDYKYAIKLAKILGLETDDTKTAVKYLSQQNPFEVIAATYQLPTRLWPCVEKKIDGVEPYITDYARNVKIPTAKNTSILIGENDQEFLGELLNKDDAFFENIDIFRHHFREGFDFTEEELTEMVEKTKLFYIGDNKMSSKMEREIAAFDNEFYWKYPTERAIREFFDNGVTSLYRYLFSYSGNRNMEKIKYPGVSKVAGAFHADEIGYLYEVSYYDEPNKEDQLVIDRMTAMWTNFAKYGDPTPEVTELLPVKWPAMTAKNYSYLEIGSELEVKVSRPCPKATAFWDLFYKLNEKKRIGYKDKNTTSKLHFEKVQE